MNIEITGDSAEYEYITEAIELSKDVDGMCLEIGLRRGMGTKTIIDAVRQFCPSKPIISIDPYGNIPYVGREPVGPIHLDYTNPMRNECMAALWTYIVENPVHYQFFNWTDAYFFEKMQDGVVWYDLNEGLHEYYSTVVLDGPHDVKSIKAELDFFVPRMKSGATIVFDDITPDFYDHSEIEKYLGCNWAIIRSGNKKQICQKIK